MESSKHQKNERTDRIGRAGEIGDPRELEELEEPCPQSVLLPNCHYNSNDSTEKLKHCKGIILIRDLQGESADAENQDEDVGDKGGEVGRLALNLVIPIVYPTLRARL